jgi:hypothetical protein
MMPMPFRMCDFWAIHREQTDEHGRLVVTGALPGGTWNSRDVVQATFPARQHGPKGGWVAADVREPPADAAMDGAWWPRVPGGFALP